MATATVDPDRRPPPPPPLRSDSIPTIDLRLLSQSELYSLSTCSNSSYGLNRCDDVVIPTIDRSVFNESAGSRKQTYSRLRLAPAGSSTSIKTTIHRRTPHHRSSRAPTINNINDPEQAENSQIIRVLKDLFKSDPNFEDSVPIEGENDINVVAPVNPEDSVSIEVENDINVVAPEVLNPEDSVPVEVENNINVVTPEVLNPEDSFPVEVENDINVVASELLNPEDSIQIEVENDSDVVAPELLNPEVSAPVGVEKDIDVVAPELLNPEDPVSVGVENNIDVFAPEFLNPEDSVPPGVGNDINVVVPELLKPEMKRKRGRPRKHENAVLIRPPAAKRMRDNMVKKEVVFDNDRDKETLNSKGEKVNIASLGRLEDPYGPEIRRRTEGMSTEDELLGFLGGLNGQWGSIRKKKRVVDASDFGDVLPNGWRLSLSVKKKAGSVWLFCRRYISPSGRQFESCKEVSMYLMSILGEENFDEPNHTLSTNYDDFALKGASVNAADPLVREVKRRGRPRKHENAVSVPVTKRMHDDTVKKDVVFDNDRDREIVNSKGEEVNIANLGRLEDPYGPEISRRTEGMSTEDELLGFLSGLNGQWGTSRKKKRLVDASDFGDVLPNGWRLSLSIKKKTGHVWLFCRRYISPSGRQFESCKEVSMYLMSLLGEENLDKPNHTHSTHSDDFALKEVSVNAADHFVQDGRKRGRPRKHENVAFIPVAKRIRDDTIKKEVVFDNDRDRETLNDRGEKVNIENLGSLEDPYGPEIWRRTGRMSTEDELLGYLGGLNGQWETSTKKKRVVDASDFGDALPKGWKLSLSIKKKAGHVWLFCRRYISPSGRQFESCKEISMYLQSIVGEENLDKPNVTHSIDDDVALKGAYANVEDLYVQDGPSASLTPLHTGCEKQEELFKCLKCLMIFEGKISLLNHQVLAHKNESAHFDSAISDCTLVKDGTFECQSCHETFYERNQYNGHIGTHVTNENRTSEASEATIVEKPIDLDKDLPASGSDKLVSSPQSDHKLSSGMEHRRNELVHDLNTLAHGIKGGDIDMNGDVLVEESGDGIETNYNLDDNEVLETDNAPDVSFSKSEFSFGNEASMSIYENNGKFESSGGTVDCVDDKSERVLDQGTSSGRCLLSPLSNKSLGGASAVIEKDTVGMPNGQDAVSETGVTHVEKIIVGESASVEVPNHVVSETGLQTSSFSGKKGFGANINDMHIFSSFDELTSEKEKVVNSESSSGVFHGVGLDEDYVAEAKKISDSESLSLFSPNSDTFSTVNNATLISSKTQKSPQKVGLIAAPVDRDTRGFDGNRFYGIPSSKLDGQYEVRSSAFGSYNVSSMDGVTSVQKEGNFNSRSSLSPWYEKERLNENVGRKVPVPIMEQPRTQMSKEKFHIENDVNNASSNKSRVADLDEFQIFRNNESINNEVASLGSSRNGFNADVMAFNAGKNLEFSPLLPPGNEQSFGFQDDVTGLYDNAHESSERGLLDHFCVDETSDDIFGIKFDEERNTGIHELSLTFGNPHALYEDTFSVGQKKDGGSSVVPAKIEGTFDVQTNLSMVNNSMGRTWEDLRSDEFRSSEQRKFMIGSGSNQNQRGETVPGGMWKTGQGSQLQSGLVNSHPQMQPPSRFHSFISDKAEDGPFRYNDGSSVSGLRSGRSEPLEFSFLTGRSDHNPNALQGGPSSRVFPYNTGMEQAFGSPFWIGKNGMMPNMGGRHVVTSVCPWCRNEFHPQAMGIHPETQGGMGSLCPACSAGYSGRVNML